jgi:hypothetical protein
MVQSHAFIDDLIKMQFTDLIEKVIEYMGGPSKIVQFNGHLLPALRDFLFQNYRDSISEKALVEHVTRCIIHEKRDLLRDISKKSNKSLHNALELLIRRDLVYHVEWTIINLKIKFPNKLVLLNIRIRKMNMINMLIERRIITQFTKSAIKCCIESGNFKLLCTIYDNNMYNFEKNKRMLYETAAKCNAKFIMEWLKMHNLSTNIDDYFLKCVYSNNIDMVSTLLSHHQYSCPDDITQKLEESDNNEMIFILKNHNCIKRDSRIDIKIPYLSFFINSPDRFFI